MKDSIKNKIKETIKKTRLKRKSQKCRTFELKIDESHLNKTQKEYLKMFFVEAKWLYNYILSQDNPFDYDYKTNPIKKKNKDGEFEDITLKYLSAKNKQDILYQLRQNIYSLSKAKKKGLEIGELKFKSNCKAIELSQYGTTHEIISINRIRINKINKPLKVHGLDQIKEDYDLANAKLIKKPSGYYIKLTCYEFIKPEQPTNKKDIGIDFGIKNNITTSEGEIFNISIEETERLKRLMTKMNRRQIKGSKNRYKTKHLIQKEYEKINNKKKDAANKIVNYLLTNYSHVYIQDENLRGWQSGWFGKQIQHSCMGTIKSKLKQFNSVTVVDGYFPTTKMCYKCGKINTISLDERTYTCVCGLSEDRDIKAAKTILLAGQNKLIPMERRNSKPVEKQTSVLTDSNVVRVSSTSMNQEASL